MVVSNDAFQRQVYLSLGGCVYGQRPQHGPLVLAGAAGASTSPPPVQIPPSPPALTLTPTPPRRDQSPPISDPARIAAPAPMGSSTHRAHVSARSEAEAPKLLYVVVADEGGGADGGFRYTRPVLQSTLQLMGCKARHAFKISRRVFEVTRIGLSGADLGHTATEASKLDGLEGVADKGDGTHERNHLVMRDVLSSVKHVERSNSLQFELYKRQTTVVITRDAFLDVVCDALSQYKYVGPNQRADFSLACRIKERKESVTVLLCGTSGCGKSTLSSLLASRLGVTTVVSTDSIRHMMRSFVDEKENPLVWASTYHAGEYLDPVAVAKAKARRKAKKLSGVSSKVPQEETRESERTNANQNSDTGTELIGKKQMTIEGFKAQSEMVIDGLDRLITSWEDRKESVIVEGVHLSLNFVMGLMKRHPSIIPFMLYISNEEKHMERFAVRAKYMTLDPSKNKYIKYIRNIRTIQEYLCNRADKHLVPKVNNSNVDRSVAAIHATVFSCLRRRVAGEQLYDLATNTVPLVEEEYRSQCAANSLSSKGMFQLIQRKGSSRHLMALVNTDGSIARAWPVESVDDVEEPKSRTGNDKIMGGPLYGPLQIGKAEPVNLQFGGFGISAWPSDTGETSHNGSIDESRYEGTETGSRYYSSCCSSPRMSDCAAKELKEESSVSGSDEEAVDRQCADTDEDLSDIDDRLIHEEIEGSVDEESTKSDEEYDDLAIRDSLENGYWSDEDEPHDEQKSLLMNKSRLTTAATEGVGSEKYNKNLDLFLKASCKCVGTLRFHPPLPLERTSRSPDGRVKKRSLSDTTGFIVHAEGYSVLDKQGSLRSQGTIISAAP